MDKVKRLVESSWWDRQTVGESGSCSDGRGHGQYIFYPVFSCGWDCVPSLLFGLRQTMVGVMAWWQPPSKRLAPAVTLSAPGPAAGRCQSRLFWELLDTHRQVGVSLWWGHCSFLLGPGAYKVLFVPSKYLLPQSCRSSVVKSQTQSQIPRGFSVPLPDPQVGKSVVGPRTFFNSERVSLV